MADHAARRTLGVAFGAAIAAMLPSTETEDQLMGGRVRLRQPRDGYRAAIDPVFLAASVAAEPRQLVLDVGCGPGAAMLCLAARVSELPNGPRVDTSAVQVQRRADRRAEQKLARRDRRRWAVIGCAILAGSFGATVGVLDVLH